MSAAISTATDRPYGIKRVCAVWGSAPIDLLRGTTRP